MWQPTDEQRSTIREMAGHGMPTADIARIIAKGVSESDFLKACASDLEEGQIHANAKLAEQLYTQAVNGNTAALLHLSRQQSGGTLPSICTTSEMCSWLGITKVALHDMRKRGVCEMVSRDRWDCKKTVQAVMRHYRDVAAGRKAESHDGEAIDLVTERALLAREQRISCEMDNDVKRGNLLRIEDVRETMAKLVKILVRNVATLGDRVERDKRVAPEIVVYIEGAVGQIRDEIAAEMDREFAD